MSLKKKRKSSCPFASANRADIFNSDYSDQEQNRWENDTVCASRARTEGKGNDEYDESPEPDPQESWQSWPINQLLPAIACKKIS